MRRVGGVNVAGAAVDSRYPVYNFLLLFPGLLRSVISDDIMTSLLKKLSI